ncbi:MAG: hypothetical protein PHS04_14995 [Tissierellia bacterium]|nr:hypothetical protein [Tissierellia bacterium]
MHSFPHTSHVDFSTKPREKFEKMSQSDFMHAMDMCKPMLLEILRKGYGDELSFQNVFYPFFMFLGDKSVKGNVINPIQTNVSALLDNIYADTSFSLDEFDMWCKQYIDDIDRVRPINEPWLSTVDAHTQKRRVDLTQDIAFFLDVITLQIPLPKTVETFFAKRDGRSLPKELDAWVCHDGWSSNECRCLFGGWVTLSQKDKNGNPKEEEVVSRHEQFILQNEWKYSLQALSHVQKEIKKFLWQSVQTQEQYHPKITQALNVFLMNVENAAWSYAFMPKVTEDAYRRFLLASGRAIYAMAHTFPNWTPSSLYKENKSWGYFSGKADFALDTSGRALSAPPLLTGASFGNKRFFALSTWWNAIPEYKRAHMEKEIWSTSRHFAYSFLKKEESISSQFILNILNLLACGKIQKDSGIVSSVNPSLLTELIGCVVNMPGTDRVPLNFQAPAVEYDKTYSEYMQNVEATLNPYIKDLITRYGAWSILCDVLLARQKLMAYVAHNTLRPDKDGDCHNGTVKIWGDWLKKVSESILKKYEKDIHREIQVTSGRLYQESKEGKVHVEELAAYMERLALIDAKTCTRFIKKLPRHFQSADFLFKTQEPITTPKDIPIGVRLCFLNGSIRFTGADGMPLYLIARAFQGRTPMNALEEGVTSPVSCATLKTLMKWAIVSSYKKIGPNITNFVLIPGRIRGSDAHATDKRRVYVGDIMTIIMGSSYVRPFLTKFKHLWSQKVKEYICIRDDNKIQVSPFDIRNIQQRMGTTEMYRFFTSILTKDEIKEIVHAVFSTPIESVTIRKDKEGKAIYPAFNRKYRKFLTSFLECDRALKTSDFYFYDSCTLLSRWHEFKDFKKNETTPFDKQQSIDEFCQNVLTALINTNKHYYYDISSKKYNTYILKRNVGQAALDTIPDVWDRFLEVKRTCTEDHIGEEYLKRFLHMVGGQMYAGCYGDSEPHEINTSSLRTPWLWNNPMPKHFLFEKLHNGQYIADYMIENGLFPLSPDFYFEEYPGSDVRIIDVCLKNFGQKEIEQTPRGGIEEVPYQNTITPIAVFTLLLDERFWEYVARHSRGKDKNLSCFTQKLDSLFNTAEILECNFKNSHALYQHDFKVSRVRKFMTSVYSAASHVLQGVHTSSGLPVKSQRHIIKVFDSLLDKQKTEKILFIKGKTTEQTKDYSALEEAISQYKLVCGNIMAEQYAQEKNKGQSDVDFGLFL